MFNNKVENIRQCRTCFDGIEDENIHQISEYLAEFDKTIDDLLLYICHIDNKMKQFELSTEICNNCTQRLRDAYNFALQAQKAEMLAIEIRIEELTQNNNDEDECEWEEYDEEEAEEILSETIIPEICMKNVSKDVMSFKVEILDDKFNDSVNEYQVQFHKKKDLDTQEFASNLSCSDFEDVDPILVSKTQPKQMEILENNDEDLLTKSERKVIENGPRTMKRKGGRLSRLPNKEKVPCPVCNDLFSRKDVLKRHMYNLHPNDLSSIYSTKDLQKFSKNTKVKCVEKTLKPKSESGSNLKKKAEPTPAVNKPNKKKRCTICNSSRKHILKRHIINRQQNTDFLKKKHRNTKSFKVHRYKPNEKTFIQCKICLSKHKKIVDLRNHLRDHQIEIDFTKIETSVEELSQLLYPHEKVMDEKTLKCQIEKDICNKNYVYFYSIKNEFFYEQNIEKSETESDCDSDNEKEEVKIVHTKQKKVYSKRTKNPGNFPCAFCGRNYTMRKNLNRHMVVHLEENELFKCLWCGHKFSQKKSLDIHMRRHGITKDTFQTAKSILVSTISDNGPKNINCNLCNLTFTSISGLRVHLKKVHDFKTNLMKHYSIMNSLGFELHIEDSETDTDEDEYDNTLSTLKTPQYTCELCSIACNRKYELAKHQFAMHKPEVLPLKCDKCVFKTVCQDILDHHKKTQCYNEEKKFECDKCFFKFMWEENLNVHKDLLHKTVETKKLIKENRNLCTICGKEFLVNEHFKYHMRRHTGEKPHKCDHCGKAFVNSSDLKSHFRQHTGEKPYKCNVCDNSFRTASHFAVHMRQHSGERPFKCTFCGKGFVSSSTLIVHTRIHTGERPFVCGICGKKFVTGYLLRTHYKKTGHYDVDKSNEMELSN